MKLTPFRIFIAILCLFLLCFGSVSAQDIPEEPTPEIIPAGACVPVATNVVEVEFYAVWEELPPAEPTPTPAPGKEWYVINSEDLPKTGYGPDSRPLLYGLGALALAALWMTRRRRSAEK